MPTHPIFLSPWAMTWEVAQSQRVQASWEHSVHGEMKCVHPHHPRSCQGAPEELCEMESEAPVKCRAHRTPCSGPILLGVGRMMDTQSPLSPGRF